MRYLIILLSLVFLLLPATAQLRDIEPIDDIDIKPVMKCDEEIVYYEHIVHHYDKVTDCTIVKNCTVEYIYNPFNETRNYTRCKQLSRKIEYKEQVINYEKENMVCTVHDSYVICDDARGGDGNGDGICQSGETCYNFTYDSTKIYSPIKKNGEKTVSTYDKVYLTAKETEIK